jgi:hypothetical protein
VVVPLELLAPERQSDLELALAHELAHIKRRDLNWNWLPTASQDSVLLQPSGLGGQAASSASLRRWLVMRWLCMLPGQGLRDMAEFS